MPKNKTKVTTSHITLDLMCAIEDSIQLHTFDGFVIQGKDRKNPLYKDTLPYHQLTCQSCGGSFSYTAQQIVERVRDLSAFPEYSK